MHGKAYLNCILFFIKGRGWEWFKVQHGPSLASSYIYQLSMEKHIEQYASPASSYSQLVHVGNLKKKEKKRKEKNLKKYLSIHTVMFSALVLTTSKAALS